jgi:hypothetical protein
MPGSLTLVTEDLPSEVLAHRLLSHADPDARFTSNLGKRGIGFIKSKLRSLNQAAVGLRIFAIVYQDNPKNCPITMIQTWLGTARHPNLVVRFAVMEVESWIMADREAISRFLDVPINRVPQMPDMLKNPKQELVNIARLSRNRSKREDMCPAPGARNVVGPAYNIAFEKFIRENWRPTHAVRNSPSLQRAERRIRELAQRAP